MHAFTHLDRKQHGTLEFPVEYYYVDDKHPRYQMPFHWHNEWEILRILDGTLKISLDDEQYLMNKGDILVIRGGMLHGGEPEHCIYECLVFDLYGIFRSLEMVKPYLRPFYRQTLLPQGYFPAGGKEEAKRILSEMLEPFASGKGCPELETVAGLSRFFSWVRNHGAFTQAESVSSPTERIKPVLEYIESNYADAITLDNLAKVAVMNPKYFCRVFRSLTHHSPMDYLNFYRIEQAANLLDSTDLPVTEVSNRCGFYESSYFTKVFKKYKGTTPIAYRRNLRSM